MPDAPARKGNVFTNKIGPLPMWGWVAIVGGVIVVWAMYSRSKASSTAAQATSASTTPPQVFMVSPNGTTPAGTGTGTGTSTGGTTTTPPTQPPPTGSGGTTDADAGGPDTDKDHGDKGKKPHRHHKPPAHHKKTPVHHHSRVHRRPRPIDVPPGRKVNPGGRPRGVRAGA